MRTVQCVKLAAEAEGLEQPPFPGPKGEQIYQTISKQVWQEWLAHQTMLINEHRLAGFDPKAKQFLDQEREKFLFGEGAAKPEGYVPPK